MEFDIQTFSLGKSFGEIVAVHDLNLAVERGTIFGLVGPDGAGKTTTMRMLCSLISPDRGKGSIRNLDIVKDSEEIKKYIGYMPQKFSLYGDLTVMENLVFYAEIYEVPRKVMKEKIDYLLVFSNLKEHTKKLADQLSGGMKQKLALSCNLIHTPEYLFLDEPTIGVDPVARRELWKILFDLRAQGVTIFVSTPYMDEAERCDVIGLMNQGKIINQNPPANMINGFQKTILSVFADDPHQGKAFAPTLPYVEDAYLMGEEIHVVLEDDRNDQNKIFDDFVKQGIKVKEIKKIKPALEDIFVNLVRHEQENQDQK
ncbi:ABC transporter ATP-binding protein [Dehalobacterium formicoaceticum]|uniref:ABC transporter ATP-binding protein n=1 Tax=Dehalobacterium formicoaceticum TaxID=51515 RepID=A0ABT1Y3T5_9FIRM|nr:ABC transporter ATP-binding protein [Dehalobacterium formicoaceticum]MCR6545539.1 ABC transporter ATP-binding protein [Dehalobacterium formicoaceticum]